MDMAATLSARGHAVHIFTTDQDGRQRLDVPKNGPAEVRGVSIHYFRSNLRFGWPISLPLRRALFQRIRNYDIVHIHSLYLFHGALAGHYCRKFRVPYLICPHGSLDPVLYKRHRFRKLIFETLIERRNLRGSAGIHFTTEEERDLAKPVIGENRSVVAPLGLHLDEYASLPEPGEFRAAYSEIEDRDIVLHLGRLTFKKGLDILVHAFAQVAKKRDDVHLVLAGPDDEGYGARIRHWLASHGLLQRATFTGLLEGRNKLAALRDASVFALPSYSENFGISVVEAMACGLPVVISNKVNIWRDVETAGAGVVTTCDTDSCAAAILRVLTDEKQRLAMGENGPKLVAERFNWSVAGEKLETTYREIISQRYLSGSPAEMATGAK